jgi:hypothetical protein
VGHLQSSPDLTGGTGCSGVPRSPPCRRLADDFSITTRSPSRSSCASMNGFPGDRARREGREAPFLPKMTLGVFASRCALLVIK